MNFLERFGEQTPVGPGDDVPSRRRFLKTSAATLGGGFGLGLFELPARAQSGAVATSEVGGAAALKPQQQPSAFLQVRPDGEVVVQVNRLDFGQGVATALPMLVAEELDADWNRVRGALAPAGEAFKDAGFGLQMTGGSRSVRASWQQYRELGARARAMFVAAAAERWKLDASLITIEQGVVRGGRRRAGLGELADAAMRQPVPARVALKDPSRYRLIGQRVRQLGGHAKSSGRQGFGLDVQRPGLMTVLIARPPVFGAKVASFDATRAQAVKGVQAVLQVPLDRGASGVAVIASGYWPAKTARDALDVQWNLDGVERVDSALQLAMYRELAARPGVKVREADVAKLSEPGARRISAEYAFPYLAHAPMEPLNCTIELLDDGAQVWVGSQFQTVDQAAVAGVLGLKPEQVALHTVAAGGGFGRRAVPTSDYLVEAAHVAKAWRATGRREPLKVVWSREDDLRGGYYRPMHLHRVEVAHDAQGRVLAWQHRIVGQSILTGTLFERLGVKNGADVSMTEGISDSPYGLPIALEVHHPKVNVPVLWWRSVGHTHTAYVMETMVDEIARISGLDPVDYRRRLLGDSHPRHLAALNLAVEQSGYGRATLQAGRAWGVAVHEAFGSVVAYVVEASIHQGAPVLHKVTAGVHCNRAVNPLNVEAQVQGAVLMALGTTLPGAAITLRDGQVEQANFGDYTVARMPQMPSVAVYIVPSDQAPTGMGEPGLPPLAPALANAVAALTGRTPRELPFRFT